MGMGVFQQKEPKKKVRHPQNGGTKRKGPRRRGALRKPVGKFSVTLSVSICSRTVCRTSFGRALGPRSALLP